MRRAGVIACAIAASTGAVVPAQIASRPASAIVFVADGLRHGSVNPVETPAFYRVRTEGVYFTNSHAVFPAQTMPNAAAIATGHFPGDTGQFANALFVGYPLFYSGSFGLAPATMVPDVRDGIVLADINDHFGGNYLREASLLAFARSYGYSTAAVGKTGPAAFQDVSELSPVRGVVRAPVTIIIESATGSPRAVPLSAATVAMLRFAGLAPAPPPRNASDGTDTAPGTQAAAAAHRQWFADVATKAILPAFAASPEPFVLVFWTGDATSQAGARSADRNLQQILDFLDAHPEVRDSTNLFVTSDHGFSTVSSRDVDAGGRATTSYAATQRYRNAAGQPDVDEGALPPGFLAIDLARALGLPLYDPEVQVVDEVGAARYAKVDPTLARPTQGLRQRPSGSTALIGGTGRIARPTDAKVVVAQTSIHAPDNDNATVQRIVEFLTTQDYVGGIFVNDRFGRPPGALRMSDVGLTGGATTPRPAVVVSFKGFARDPADPLMTAISVGGAREQSRSDDGSLTRANTFINMAALGPGFKKRFADPVPVGNTDVQPTLAYLLGLKMPSLGKVRGRVVREALAGGPPTVRFSRRIARSAPSAGGASTVLMYQRVEEHRYLDEACFTREPVCGAR